MLKGLSKPKPKRGTEYKTRTTGKPVWLYRITDAGIFICADSKDFTIYDDYLPYSESDLILVKAVRKPIGNKPKQLTTDEKRFKADLNIFYAEALNELPDNCQECDLPLGCLSAWDARCATAHILPKKEEHGFPLIACHRANKIFLGKKNCSCHSKYDDRDGEFRSTMKVYPLVLEAFEILKLELSEHDIIRAKKYLNIKT